MPNTLQEIFEDLAQETADLSASEIEMLFTETIKILKVSMWPAKSLSTDGPVPA